MSAATPVLNIVKLNVNNRRKLTMCGEFCVCDYCGRGGRVVHHDAVPENYEHSNFCYPGRCFREYGEYVNSTGKEELVTPFCLLPKLSRVSEEEELPNFTRTCTYCGVKISLSSVSRFTFGENNECCSECFSYFFK